MTTKLVLLLPLWVPVALGTSLKFPDGIDVNVSLLLRTNPNDDVSFPYSDKIVMDQLCTARRLPPSHEDWMIFNISWNSLTDSQFYACESVDVGKDLIHEDPLTHDLTWRCKYSDPPEDFLSGCRGGITAIAIQQGISLPGTGVRIGPSLSQGWIILSKHFHEPELHQMNGSMGDIFQSTSDMDGIDFDMVPVHDAVGVKERSMFTVTPVTPVKPMPGNSLTTFQMSCHLNQVKESNKDNQIRAHPYAYHNHAHRHATHVTLSVLKEGEEHEILLANITDSDDLQKDTSLMADLVNVTLGANDKMICRCHYNITEQQEIHVGWGFMDEMCTCGFNYYADSHEEMMDSIACFADVDLISRKQDDGMKLEEEEEEEAGAREVKLQTPNVTVVHDGLMLCTAVNFSPEESSYITAITVQPEPEVFLHYTTTTCDSQSPRTGPGEPWNCPWRPGVTEDKRFPDAPVCTGNQSLPWSHNIIFAYTGFGNRSITLPPNVGIEVGGESGILSMVMGSFFADKERLDHHGYTGVSNTTLTLTKGNSNMRKASWLTLSGLGMVNASSTGCVGGVFTIDEPITIHPVYAYSHSHGYPIRTTLWAIDSSGRKVLLLDNYPQLDKVVWMGANVTLRRGDKLAYSCSYNNTSPDDVKLELDEMCNIPLIYYADGNKRMLIRQVYAVPQDSLDSDFWITRDQYSFVIRGGEC